MTDQTTMPVTYGMKARGAFQTARDRSMSGITLERRLVRLAFWRHDCRCGCRWRPLLGRRRRHTANCGWCSR